VSAAAVLFDAAALVRKGWTRHELARDAHGGCVSVSSPNAVSFCAIGAIERVQGRGIMARNGHSAWELLSSAVGGLVSEWNNRPRQTADNVALTMERVAVEQLGPRGPEAYRVGAALTRLYTECAS